MTIKLISCTVVVAHSRKVNMGISIEQFRETKDASLCFKDWFWNRMLMMFYLNVLFADIETSCYTIIQNVESSDVLVYTIDATMFIFHCL